MPDLNYYAESVIYLMRDDRRLDIGFTQVLYGVVVANSIYQLELGLSFRNLMLLLTLAFILGDWIEYQISRQEVSQTTSNYVLAFVLDVVILVVWYLITIVPASELELFFAIAAVFFLLQATWDRLILGLDLQTLFSKPHFQLGVIFTLIAALQMYTALRSEVLFATAALLFFLRKAPEWRSLVRKSPEAL